MRLALVCVLAGGLAGCGYVGDPLPPALNIPKPVLDLRVIERGANLEVSFTMPASTGEGLPLRQPGRIDLRLGPAPPPPFDVNAWLGAAREMFVEWPLPAPPPAGATGVTPQVVKQTLAAQPWAGQDVILGVRLTSPSGRLSGLSNLVAISVVPPLVAPAFTAVSRADGILLKWAPLTQPGVAYRLTRQIGSGAVQTIADVPASEYLDLVTAFGPTYQYTIQSYVRAGDINALSEPSAPLSREHVDIFPPAAPTGLAAIAGAKTIDLGWDRNTDADLAGYRIYRAVGDGAFVRLPGQIEPPSFRDTTVQTGQRYRYAISAVDQRGNESARSEPAEAEAP